MDNLGGGQHGCIGLKFCYNTSPHTSDKALYGRVPPHVVHLRHSQTKVDSINQLLQERDAILEELQFNLVKA